MTMLYCTTVILAIVANQPVFPFYVGSGRSLIVTLDSSLWDLSQFSSGEMTNHSNDYQRTLMKNKNE
jgi:hypothetical protein